MRSWYVTLGDPLAHGTPVPPPQAVDPRNHSRLMHEVRDSIASDGTAALYEALLALWASQHMDTLRRLEAHLGGPGVAAPVAASRA